MDKEQRIESIVDSWRYHAGCDFFEMHEARIEAYKLIAEKLGITFSEFMLYQIHEMMEDTK